MVYSKQYLWFEKKILHQVFLKPALHRSLTNLIYEYSSAQIEKYSEKTVSPLEKICSPWQNVLESPWPLKHVEKWSIFLNKWNGTLGIESKYILASYLPFLAGRQNVRAGIAPFFWAKYGHNSCNILDAGTMALPSSQTHGKQKQLKGLTDWWHTCPSYDPFLSPSSSFTVAILFRLSYFCDTIVTFGSWGITLSRLSENKSCCFHHFSVCMVFPPSLLQVAIGILSNLVITP